MAWTDSTTVKKHLLDLDKLPTNYTDVSIVLNPSGDGSIPHKGLTTNSEKVKRRAVIDPTEQSSVGLGGETWVGLTYDNLVPDRLVVSSDDGLQTVYVQGIDYAVDWQTGQLRRIASGSIADGQNVQVYYQRYQVMTKTTDYTIDYATGEIAYVPTGSLEPDTTLVVDYNISAASGADLLVDEAITEVEDKILARLKDEYDGASVDQGLITGATELTLAAVCRGLATRALSDGGSSMEPRAKGWQRLADAYEQQAWRTLMPFVKSPALTSGTRKPNQSWEWQ